MPVCLQSAPLLAELRCRQFASREHGAAVSVRFLSFRSSFEQSHSAGLSCSSFRADSESHAHRHCCTTSARRCPNRTRDAIASPRRSFGPPFTATAREQDNFALVLADARFSSSMFIGSPSQLHANTLGLAVESPIRPARKGRRTVEHFVKRARSPQVQRSRLAHNSMLQKRRQR